MMGRASDSSSTSTAMAAAMKNRLS
jgi:hypothetical protein